MNTIELKVGIKAVTGKALLVVTEDGDEEWVPLSQVDVDETEVELQRGAKGTLAVSAWFAAKKGWE